MAALAISLCGKVSVFFIPCGRVEIALKMDEPFLYKSRKVILFVTFVIIHVWTLYKGTKRKSGLRKLVNFSHV